MNFPQAIRSFVGYLEGTEKAAHTIKNYRQDLLAFQRFIQKEYGEEYLHKELKLDRMDPLDLQRFREHLKEKGLKINTRRRKILTVTQFMNFLAKRKKLPPEMARKVPAPHKVERIPLTVSSAQLIEAIRNLKEDTLIGQRNQALLWTLAETGCLVSEVSGLRYEQWSQINSTSAVLHIAGKFTRTVPVSVDLYQAILKLKTLSKESEWVFTGFNKFGSLGSPMTPRGVEMLVKAYGPKLGLGELTPRTFRHSIILQWFMEQIPQNEIQARLGLKTTYAFRSYEPLLKSSLKTTSTDENYPQES